MVFYGAILGEVASATAYAFGGESAGNRGVEEALASMALGGSLHASVLLEIAFEAEEFSDVVNFFYVGGFCKLDIKHGG